jgi:soluble lytic murein transglycosylase-like protein
MQHILIPSVDCRCTIPPPIFPSRLTPKVGKHSRSLQRKSHAGPPVDPIASRRSLRTIARIILAIAPFMCQIASSTLLESSARAQTAERSDAVDRFAKFIEEASARFAVPARWIRAVMQVESSGDEHALSSRGAMGLMQLMPGTWVELSVRYGLGLDPFDAHDNIIAGVAYLKDMHDRFGSAGFLAAYHAGPERYEQHLATGRPLPPETMAYVAAVTPLVEDAQGEHTAVHIRRAVPWREAPLFVERAGAP